MHFASISSPKPVSMASARRSMVFVGKVMKTGFVEGHRYLLVDYRH